MPKEKKESPPPPPKKITKVSSATLFGSSAAAANPANTTSSTTFRQPKPPSIAGSKKIIAGTNVQTYHPPILLSDLPWFSAFLKSQLNFSLGLCKIDDEFMVKITKALHASK